MDDTRFAYQLLKDRVARVPIFLPTSNVWGLIEYENSILEVQIFWPILCLIVEFWVLFHIWIQVLCQICNLQIFSSYRVCHFILLAEQTFEILMKSDLPEIFNGSCFWCRICELSKGCEDFFCFLWIFWNFLVLCLNFSSFILLYLFLYSF